MRFKQKSLHRSNINMPRECEMSSYEMSYMSWVYKFSPFYQIHQLLFEVLQLIFYLFILLLLLLQMQYLYNSNKFINYYNYYYFKVLTRQSTCFSCTAQGGKYCKKSTLRHVPIVNAVVLIELNSFDQNTGETRVCESEGGDAEHHTHTHIDH